jgi:hypothetical protein
LSIAADNDDFHGTLLGLHDFDIVAYACREWKKERY